jgi:hypothetical protein
MSDQPSLDRWYEAQERKRIEIERRRARLAGASSLAEWHEIKIADAVPPSQQTANNRRR